MNRARGALWGLALAACASGAAADDDYEALFARCVGSLIETRLAVVAEFPEIGMGRFENEADLLALRKAQADPGAALWSEFIHTGMGNSAVVREICTRADVSAIMLDLIVRDDVETACRLAEHHDKRFSFSISGLAALLSDRCE